MITTFVRDDESFEVRRHRTWLTERYPCIIKKEFP